MRATKNQGCVKISGEGPNSAQCHLKTSFLTRSGKLPGTLQQCGQCFCPKGLLQMVVRGASFVTQRRVKGKEEVGPKIDFWVRSPVRGGALLGRTGGSGHGTEKGGRS